ncbi:MAG: radical SAM family heme chaperone HemW [Sphingobacteriales bacterium]|nr:MAG: radical SAM family heme chaperone HemW [Sphingobacteriales bacterium]
MAGIYLHIPFCKQACNYCNFHFSTSLGMKEDLLKAIHTELELQRNYLAGAPVETIYFGGGTPSLLSADEINRITEHIFQQYNVSNLKEFTLEANPDDLSVAYLRSLKDTQVNRFSIGVQSFKQADLQYMNRAHNANEAEYAIKAAQDIGFEKLSIDLIYGTPGLTDNEWLANVNKVRELQIPHFSAYALTVEEGTALHHSIKKKKTKPVDNEQSAAQFEILAEQAAAMGYEQYEISNLALPGQYAIHNTNYWTGVPYLGIGPSAHSFDGDKRRWNVANNALYTKGLLAEQKLNYEEESLTQEQRLNEYIMTSLRTMWGCDLQKIEKEYGSTVVKQILHDAEEFFDKQQLVHTGDKLFLTHEGKLFADHIAALLFV